MLGWVHVSLEPYAVVRFAGSGGYMHTSSASSLHAVFMGEQSVVLLIEWELVSVWCMCVCG